MSQTRARLPQGLLTLSATFSTSGPILVVEAASSKEVYELRSQLIAREGVEHVIWEHLRWFDEHVSRSAAPEVMGPSIGEPPRPRVPRHSIRLIDLGPDRVLRTESVTTDTTLFSPR